MNGSLIHTDLGPVPYVLFSLASIATGALFELRAALTNRARRRGYTERKNESRPRFTVARDSSRETHAASR
jgi:hypothetical protein